MLADLLTDFLTYTLIGSAATIRNKTILIVFGLITLVASTVLFFYFRSLPPINVENYYSTEINYSRVYYEKNTDSSEIILVSGEQDYKIYYQIWTKAYSPEVIVDGLAKSNRAKIWLVSTDSHEIKGIITSTFIIDPALGIAWDKDNRQTGVILSTVFIFCGGILMLIPIFFSKHL